MLYFLVLLLFGYFGWCEKPRKWIFYALLGLAPLAMLQLAVRNWTLEEAGLPYSHDTTVYATSLGVWFASSIALGLISYGVGYVLQRLLTHENRRQQNYERHAPHWIYRILYVGGCLLFFGLIGSLLSIPGLMYFEKTEYFDYLTHHERQTIRAFLFFIPTILLALIGLFFSKLTFKKVLGA